MSGIDIAIELTDDVSTGLDRLIAAAVDLMPAMADIAGHLADETRERFETSKGPDGMPWLPSRRVLDGAKGKDGHPTDKTLVDTGDLLASIAEDWGSDYAAAGPEASGGAAIYAAIHQFGGTITPREGREGKDGHRPALSFGGRYLAKVVIPARPYLGWTDGDSDYAVGVLADHLAASTGGGSTA